LGGKNQKPYVLFLLTLGDQFSKVAEKKDYHYFWSDIPSAQVKVKENLNSFGFATPKKLANLCLKKIFTQKLQKLKGFQNKLLCHIGSFKKNSAKQGGSFGVSWMAEIKPRGVKDKAFFGFKKHGKPLHFTEVANLIDKFNYNLPNKKTYPQTVHNEW